MSQEAEPSIIDYARFYGLIRNHLEPHPLQALAARDSFPSIEPESHSRLSEIDFANFQIPEERLTVSAGAASLLSCIKALVTEIPQRQEDGVEIHRLQYMKHELPLLRSVHELDMLNFAPQVVTDLKHEFLPLETVDEEADEGLTWPSKCHDLPDQYARRSASEKLQVSSDAFAFLKEILAFHRESGIRENFEHDDLYYKKGIKVDLLSPPLLPLSPSLQPFVPSSETGHLDLLSDRTSPSRQEICDVERIIFDSDATILPMKQLDDSSQCSDQMLLDSESIGDIYSPLRGIKNSPSSPPPLRAPLKDRKIEVPLSPAKSERLPLWRRKSVTFSEALPELIPDLPLPIPKPEATSSSDTDTFFENAVASIGVKAEREIEQEQLQEEDTTLRVTVPIMDFSLPIAPWRASTTTATSHGADDMYKETLKEIKARHFSNDSFKKHFWPINGKAERELRWAPFPAALGRVDTQESFLDDGSLAMYLARPDRLNIDILTWKPDGLRILDELAEMDEEELQEGTFPEDKDFESLVRKRKLELEENTSISPPSNRAPKATSSAIAIERYKEEGAVGGLPARQYKIQATTGRENPGSTFADSLSAMGALDDFLNVRKGIIEKPKLKADHHFPSVPSTKQPIPVPADTFKPSSKSEVNILPSPVITPPIIPCPFVVSASFLSNRSLARNIRTLFPSAEFIERDYDLYKPPQQRPPSKSYASAPSPKDRNLARQIQNLVPSANYIERDFNLYLASQQRPPSKPSTAPQVLSTMADEADIILSPSTSLVWTTLQKIKQRSLPGQVARSAVRERILTTSPRYERLLILISQDRYTSDLAGSISELDANDCEALIELTSFCANLQHEVTTTFIAGSEDDLAKWIVAMMVKYGVTEQEEIKLLQDETQWEVFLRRAGMNAFAAQAILGKLKAPSGGEGGVVDGVDFGLTAFVKMSLEERLVRFETLLGGRRVLKRVSNVLDARW
ncbi:hypothetical protein N7G274_003038 [Stereocaulon virgatum]|uniref:Uncharacterized protein n=1 Tax=Stereocaulon virgatum TaxID=373712 RepID=A0ABR4ALM5_9LECA